MRSLLVGAALLICVPAHAQETTGSESLIDRLNEAVEEAQSTDQTEPAPMPSESDDRPNVTVVPMDEPAETTLGDLPNWGIVVRDQSGDIVDLFGQVDYEVTSDGLVNVPGYENPPGTSLQLVPQNEYLNSWASWTGLDSKFKPLEDLTGPVETATTFLAQELCAKKWRPTGITLSLVVSASGTILFASAGTQAGSEVNWDFQDVCGRFGLEGEGIPFE